VHQTSLKNQKSIKIVPADQDASVPGGIVSSDRAALPPNCYVAPMVPLKKPIPVRKKTRKKR
jgi:hypothetical protein